MHAPKLMNHISRWAHQAPPRKLQIFLIGAVVLVAVAVGQAGTLKHLNEVTPADLQSSIHDSLAQERVAIKDTLGHYGIASTSTIGTIQTTANNALPKTAVRDSANAAITANTTLQPKSAVPDSSTAFWNRILAGKIWNAALGVGETPNTKTQFAVKGTSATDSLLVLHDSTGRTVFHADSTGNFRSYGTSGVDLIWKMENNASGTGAGNGFQLFYGADKTISMMNYENANFNFGVNGTTIITLLPKGQLGFGGSTSSAFMGLIRANTDTCKYLMDMTKSGVVVAYDDSSGNSWRKGTITAGAINTTPVGSTTPSTGAFTSLSGIGLKLGLFSTTLTNGLYSGITDSLTAGEALALGDVCYMHSSGKMYKAQADSELTCGGEAIALGTISSQAVGLFLRYGYICVSAWSTVQTLGSPVYIDDDTAGLPTTTVPPDVGDCVFGLGTCTGTDLLFFNPPMKSMYVVR